MKIYLSMPMSGRPYGEVLEGFDAATDQLDRIGFRVLSPAVFEQGMHLQPEIVACAEAVAHLPHCGAAEMVARDKWMIRQADLVYCNLTGAKAASIGCVAELVLAHAYKTYTVVAREPGGPHDHCFVNTLADCIVDDDAAAMDYLAQLFYLGADE